MKGFLSLLANGGLPGVCSTGVLSFTWNSTCEFLDSCKSYQILPGVFFENRFGCWGIMCNSMCKDYLFLVVESHCLGMPGHFTILCFQIFKDGNQRWQYQIFQTTLPETNIAPEN